MMSTCPPSKMQIWSQVIKERTVRSVSRKQALGGLHNDFDGESSSQTSAHYSYGAHPSSSVHETQKIRVEVMTENTKTWEMLQKMMMQMQAQIPSPTRQVGEVLQWK